MHVIKMKFLRIIEIRYDTLKLYFVGKINRNIENGNRCIRYESIIIISESFPFAVMEMMSVYLTDLYSSVCHITRHVKWKQFTIAKTTV